MRVIQSFSGERRGSAREVVLVASKAQVQRLQTVEAAHMEEALSAAGPSPELGGTRELPAVGRYSKQKEQQGWQAEMQWSIGAGGLHDLE